MCVRNVYVPRILPPPREAERGSERNLLASYMWVKNLGTLEYSSTYMYVCTSLPWPVLCLSSPTEQSTYVEYCTYPHPQFRLFDKVSALAMYLLTPN